MKKKRRFGLVIVALIISMNTMLAFAKTDSATRSFKCKGIDVSGSATVSISSGSFGINKAKSNGNIYGSDVWMTSAGYYYTKVTIKGDRGGSGSYKMYNNNLSGNTSIKGYCMWMATMKISFDGKDIAGWAVCCS